uniref:ATP synthase complex subunit 8 n=1 Tax=Polychrus marmoratus TaxID=38934 RepID=C4T8F2_POLMR|nr:ATP synthase F0 subunit 8 [Polychrus marmoratus]BAH70464.1 ATPase subunit 8 [Polychrus marmoratus]
MPQLNPHPWFLILLLTWATTMLIFLTKTLNSKHLNHLMPSSLQMKTPPSWTWPWF